MPILIQILLIILVLSFPFVFFKMYLNPNQTNYAFNDCEPILNNENFVVVGKTKILGKQRHLSPILFEFGNNQNDQKIRVVTIKDIQEIGTDLEIEFIDSSYINSMTLVIKRIDKILKDKLLHFKTSNYAV